MQISTVLPTKANDDPNYLVLPMEFCVFAVSMRIVPACRLLIALKMAYRSGSARVTRQDIARIAETVGIKDWRTVSRYLQTLQGHGLLRYSEGRSLRLWSLFKRFNRWQRGIRFNPTDNLRQVLFAGIAGFFIRITNRKRKSQNRQGQLKSFHLAGGVSLNFLHTVLKLSVTRCSQLKRNPFMKVTHRFEPAGFTRFDLGLLRNDDPATGRKYVCRNGQVWRQQVDKIEVSGIEYSRRKVA